MPDRLEWLRRELDISTEQVRLMTLYRRWAKLTLLSCLVGVLLGARVIFKDGPVTDSEMWGVLGLQVITFVTLSITWSIRRDLRKVGVDW